MHFDKFSVKKTQLSEKKKTFSPCFHLVIEILVKLWENCPAASARVPTPTLSFVFLYLAVHCFNASGCSRKPLFSTSSRHRSSQAKKKKPGLNRVKDVSSYKFEVSNI